MKKNVSKLRFADVPLNLLDFSGDLPSLSEFDHFEVLPDGRVYAHYL